MPIIFASVEPSAQAWKPVLDALTGAITVADVMGMLASLVTVGVAFVLAWWGCRKAVSAFMAAFKSGKFKF